MNKVHNIEWQNRLLRSIPGRVFAVDLKGNFTFWNSDSAKYFGYKKSLVIGKMNCKKLFVDKKDSERILKTARRKGSFEGEVALINKTGDKLYTYLSIKKHINSRGQHIGYICLNNDIAKLKNLELELENSLDKHKSLFENSNDIIYFLDLKGRFADINKAAEKAIGESKKNIIGKKFSYVLHPDYTEIAKKKFIKGLKGERINPYFLKIITKKGETRTLQLRPSPIKRKGRIIGRFGIATDVTDLKKIEEELIKSENKYRGIFENASDIIFYVDKEGKFLNINKRAEEFLGKTKAQIMGKKFTSIIHPDSIPSVIRTFKDGLAGKQIEPYTLKAIGKNGKVRIFETKTSPLIEAGKIIGRFGVARDVTDAKLAEDEIRQMSIFLDTIIDNANVWISVFDKNGNVLLWNKAAEEISGYSRKEIIGHKKMWKFVYPDANYRNFILKLINKLIKEGGVSEGKESKITDKAGNIKTIEWYSRNLQDSEKNTIGLITLGTDVTKRKEAEHEAEQIKRQQDAILSNIPDIAWLKDKESRFIAVNEPFAKTLGLKPNDLIGKTDLDFYPKELAKMYRADDKEVIKSKRRKRVEEPYQDAFGKRVWLDTIKTPIYNEKNQVVGTTGIARDISDLKKFQSDLQKSQERWKSLAQNAPDFLVIVNQEHKIQYINRTISPHSREEVFNKSIYNYINPDYCNTAKKTIDKVLKTGKPGTYINLGKGSDNTAAWYEVHVGPIKHEKKIVAATLFISDITERKKRDEALKQSERKYKELSNSLPQVIFETDANGKLTFVNKFAYKLFKYSKKEFEKGIYAFDMLAPDDSKRAMKRFSELLRGAKPGSGEYTAIKKNGSTFPSIIYSTIIKQNGNPLGLRGMLIDISEIKNIEEALRESEKRYRVLFDGSPEGIAVADYETRKFKYANPAISRMFGYSQKEITRLGVKDLHPKDSVKHVFKEFELQASGAKPIAMDLPCKRKDGTIFYADVHSRPVIIDGRKSVVGFFSDVTEKKSLLEEKINLSRLAAIGTLSASVAHEIRNPLFSISTIAQSVQRECRTEENEEILDAMIKEISRLKEFIDSMLFYSRPQKASRKDVDPIEIIDDILVANRELLKEKKIRINTINLFNSKKNIQADPDQIRRLFVNLLINAQEASNSRGTITITSKPIQNGQGISIEFHNKGKHIKKNDLTSLFDLFYSTKPKGCGLGLPICKKIVESHNGRISVHSSKNSGTVFSVQL